jgi:hypothetical protein
MVAAGEVVSGGAVVGAAADAGGAVVASADTGSSVEQPAGSARTRNIAVVANSFFSAGLPNAQRAWSSGLLKET